MPFLLFQGVRDYIYKNPVKITEYTPDLNSYLGAIGFMQPVELLSLKEVLLSDLMDWLTESTGPTLVAADTQDEPHSALALLWTPESLQDITQAKVGVGLVYKAPYIQAASFNQAFYSLRSASSPSPDQKVLEPSLLFVSITEASRLVPQPAERPLFLDVRGPEFVTNAQVPRSPKVFRGFRLHKTYMATPGSKAVQVVLPRLRGEGTPPVASYWKPRTIPAYRGGGNVEAPLAVASTDHWNQINDCVYPACLADFRQRFEASKGAPPETNPLVIGTAFISTGDASTSLPGSSTQSSTPTKSSGSVEAATKIIQEILAVRVEALQDLSLVRETDRALARAFAAEFSRIQLVVGDDLNTSLRGLAVDLKNATSDLLKDLDTAYRGMTGQATVSPSMGLAMSRFQRLVQMKLAAPLLRLDAAREDIQTFLRTRLSESHARKVLTSYQTSLAEKVEAHESRIRDIAIRKTLEDPEVALRIMVGMAASLPIETKLFPSYLNGVLGSLGIGATDTGNPPASPKEGVARRWATITQEAIWRMEGKSTPVEVAPEVPQGLHLGYEDDFLSRRTEDIPRVFSDPEFLMEIGHSAYGWDCPKPADGQESSPNVGPKDATGGTDSPTSPFPMDLPSSAGTPLDSQPPSPAKVLDGSDTGSARSGSTEILPATEAAGSSARSERMRSLRSRRRKASVGSEDEAPPEKRTATSKETGRSESSVLPEKAEEVMLNSRFKTYDKDLPEAKHVRALIIGLEDKQPLSQTDIDNSPIYELRRAADDSGSTSPAVIGHHWIPHLQSKGYLATCPPKEAILKDKWLPLYTRAGVLKHVSNLKTLLRKEPDCALVAVVLPKVPFDTDWDFPLPLLHLAECLNRVSVNAEGHSRRQVAFCPYCGITNENASTGRSHAKKHLGIAYLCGGCYAKLYKRPQALCLHRQLCQAVVIAQKE